MKQIGDSINFRNEAQPGAKRRGWLKVAASLFFVVLTYFILTAAVHFSSRQAATIVCLSLAGVGYVNYRSFAVLRKAEEAAKSKSSWEFLPYSVRVDPNWREILTDFKLIATEHDWERAKPAIYGTLPYGFSFTVLQRTDESSLIFHPDPRSGFVREVEFCHDVPAIEFKDTSNRLKIFMEDRGDGYDLGVIVPEKWWDQVKSDCPKPLRETHGELWYEAKLTLARISCAEFSWYCQPEYAVGPGNITETDPQYYVYKEWEETITSRRDEERLRFGWTQDTYCVAHKYFEVQHKPI